LTGRSKYVVKLKNGEPSERYWLQLFRDWLQGLQDKLDEAERLGILENYDYNNFTKTPDLDIAYSLTCSAGNDYNCSRVSQFVLFFESKTNKKNVIKGRERKDDR
jgi:patched 1 protein